MYSGLFRLSHRSLMAKIVVLCKHFFRILYRMLFHKKKKKKNYAAVVILICLYFCFEIMWNISCRGSPSIAFVYLSCDDTTTQPSSFVGGRQLAERMASEF